MNIYHFIRREEKKNISFVKKIMKFNNIKFHKNFKKYILETIEFNVKNRIIHIIQFEANISIKAEIASNNNEFIKISQSREWLDYFYEEYPSLIDYFKTEYDKVRNNILVVIKALSNDYSLLKLNKNFKLKQIDIGKGDYHDNLSTSKIIFEPFYTLYYKPRSLSIDNFILRFMSDLEKDFNRKMFYNVLNIERNSYGWSLPVSIEECVLIDQVKDYYFNIGVLTAISYFLNIEDLIYDNLISTKGKIALIDLA